MGDSFYAANVSMELPANSRSALMASLECCFRDAQPRWNPATCLTRCEGGHNARLSEVGVLP